MWRPRYGRAVRDLTRLPKAHLHVHLESAVRWSTLAELAAANAVPLPAAAGLPTADPGVAGFFALNEAVRRCLRTPGDFHRVAVEFCQDEAAQGTGYVEVTFTAAAHGERLGDLDMPLNAVLAGLAEGQDRHGVVCRLILDHSRRRPVARAWQTLGLARRNAGHVVAVGLAGDEAYPGEPFVPVWAAARDAGLRVVHHAGESAGPESIRQAVTTGGAERLGHGIRLLDDPGLLAEVRARGIALEVCPASNVALGLVPSLAAHPLPRLRAAGLTVTLNADIPAVTGRSLAQEYATARHGFGYSDTALAALARAGVDASFAPADVRADLHRGIDDWLRTDAR